MIHLRHYSIVVLLVVGLVLQTGASSGGEQRQSQPVTLKVLLLPYLDYVPLYIAEEEGYFAEQGLQVEFVRMTRSTAAIPILAQGKLDVFAGVLRAGLLNAMARGAKIKFVAGQTYVAPTGCTYVALVVRRALVESGELDNPAQLQGRRISTSRATPSEYFLEKLLNAAGLTLEDIEIVDIPTPLEPEALEKGTIDALDATEPWLTRILQAGHAVILMRAEQVMPNFERAFIAYGPALLDQNPEAGRRFMVAYLKAVRQYNQGKTDRNLEIIAKHTGLDQELLREVCWPPLRNDGQINMQSVLEFQAWALEKGYLDSTLTEDHFWDPRFVEYANQVLDTSP